MLYHFNKQGLKRSTEKNDYFVSDKSVSYSNIKNLGIKRIYKYNPSTSSYKKIELTDSYIASHGSDVLKNSYKFIVNKDTLDLALSKLVKTRILFQ